jgi:hypothetical protein
MPFQLGRQRRQQPLDQVVVLDADAGERGALPLVEQAVVLPHAQLAQVGEVHLRLDPGRLPRQPRVGGEPPAEEAGELPVAVADLAKRLDPGGEQPPPQRQPGGGIARQPPVLAVEEPLERLRDPVAAAATPPRPRHSIGEPRVRRRRRYREALPVAAQRPAPQALAGRGPHRRSQVAATVQRLVQDLAAGLGQQLPVTSRHTDQVGGDKPDIGEPRLEILQVADLRLLIAGEQIR